MVDFSLEQKLLEAHHAEYCIAGVDEVGRGPWAGPVMVCAVILDPMHIPAGLEDSKKLSAARRMTLAKQIEDYAQVSIATASVEEIDQMNILAASMLAMQRALAGLAKVDYALIDGNRLPDPLPCPARAIVKGDQKSASIAAASIIAKVTRDAYMCNLATQFPGYGWESNAGYGTKLHKIGLQELGVSPHHRCSFKPIHNMLYPTKPL